MIRLTCFIIITLICSSCKNRVVDKGVIDLKSIQRFDVRNLEITKLVQLEATDSKLLGMHLDVRISNDRYWVLDLNNPSSVFGFDAEGKSLGLVAEVGEGPNTLLNIRDFIVSNDTVIVLSNLGDKILISRWNTENVLIDKKEVNVNGFSFTQNNGNWYVYSGYNKVAGDYRLKSFDEDFNLIHEHLKKDFDDGLLPLVERAFFEGSEGVLFKESLRPEVYRIKNGRIELDYHLDFGKYQVPEDFWRLNPFEGFELINRRGFANISFMAENKNHFLIEVQIQENSQAKKEILFLEKDSGRMLKLEVNQEGSGQFYSPMGFDGQGNILFLSYAQFFDKDKFGKKSNEVIGLERIEPNGNPVVMYAEIPEFK